MNMYRIFIVFICLACEGHGRRLQKFTELVQRSEAVADLGWSPMSYSLAEVDNLDGESDDKDDSNEDDNSEDQGNSEDSDDEEDSDDNTLSETIALSDSAGDEDDSDNSAVSDAIVLDDEFDDNAASEAEYDGESEDAEGDDPGGADDVSAEGETEPEQEEQPQEQKISRMMVIEYIQGPEKKAPAEASFPQGDGDTPSPENAGNKDGDDRQQECQCQTCCLMRRLTSAQLPDEAKEVAKRELDRLKSMPPTHPEHSTIVEYLEWIADLPWNKSSDDRLTISAARAQLEADHFGMEKVKARILEYLSVVKLKGDLRSPILCLHGPPGIGKTSLGRSVADALNRDFYRVSLGGVHSEAEVRGHRRTYVGAMPGLIIQALKKCGSNNCVIMLDEIDKLGQHSFNGDPSAALLEVLDPEQNDAFRDHFLNLPFDLSRVLFIATANELDTIPRPLRDRMEIIEMSGYTVEEKIQIARNHLLPKQRKNHGLCDSDIDIDAPAIDALISGYTREAGVRELDRQLAALCRSVAAKTAEAIEAAEEAKALAEANHTNQTSSGCAEGGCENFGDDESVPAEGIVVEEAAEGTGEVAQGAGDRTDAGDDLPYAAHVAPLHSAATSAEAATLHNPKRTLRFGSHRPFANGQFHLHEHPAAGSGLRRVPGLSANPRRWHKQ